MVTKLLKGQNILRLFSVRFLSIQNSSEGELFEAFGNEAQKIGGGGRVKDERPVHIVQLQMRRW